MGIVMLAVSSSIPFRRAVAMLTPITADEEEVVNECNLLLNNLSANDASTAAADTHSGHGCDEWQSNEPTIAWPAYLAVCPGGMTMKPMPQPVIFTTTTTTI